MSNTDESIDRFGWLKQGHRFMGFAIYNQGASWYVRDSMFVSGLRHCETLADAKEFIRLMRRFSLEKKPVQQLSLGAR